MKTKKNILIAFVLNLGFSIFELLGGVFTGSVAILSDAIHDMGDAASIGVAYFLEKKSGRQPDERYTYGYGRYAILGSIITTLFLLAGSAVVVYRAIQRILIPADIHYDGMIVFAIVGVCVNLAAAFVTREGDSLNQKAVNLHMLEDVLGWAVVLVGAVVMRLTDIQIIDPIMSMGVAVYIIVNAVRNLKEAIELILEKAPREIDVQELEEHISEIAGVQDVHHIHVWSMDGQNHYATMHVVTNGNPHQIKRLVRGELEEHGIGHVTLEMEQEGEHCNERHCSVAHRQISHHHHH